jgi:nucleotide-binding universal stress UspA family protein
VDFSEFSRRALERAAVLARWYEAELVALHAAPLVPFNFPLAPGVSQATLEPFDLETMASELRAFTAEVAATCPRLQLIVRPGAAAPVILDLARGLGADLLVLGTHGRSGLQRLVLGSVAEKVVRQAPCPVLTVPCAVEGHPDKPVFEHVLCGVDFLETSQRAVEYALSLAEEANGRLTLLHTIEWVPDERHPTHATFGLNLYRQAVLTEARARLAELVPAEARDWCQVDMRVACGEPSVEILRAAAAERADLVVLGAGHPGALDRMLFGSTAPQVLRQAPCPVLTVRGGGEATRHEGLDRTIPRPGGREGRSRDRRGAPQGRTS